MILFKVGNEGEGRRALRRLEGAFPVRPEPARSRETLHADTYDWRLFHAGACLEWSSAGDDGELDWTDASGRVRFRWRGERPPAFADDLPAGPLRDEMALAARRRLTLLPRQSARRQHCCSPTNPRRAHGGGLWRRSCCTLGRCSGSRRPWRST